MKKIFLFSLLFVSYFSNAQVATSSENIKGWHLKDKVSDGFAGISLTKAYDFLKGKKSTPVIVAVIDSGIDTLHEDLKPILWTNKKEIPNNGIDDDGNGFIDDVHGWNFLGNANGTMVEKAAGEVARVYHNLKSKYEGKTIDTNLLSKDDKLEFLMYTKAAKEIEPSTDNTFMITTLNRLATNINLWDSTIKKDANLTDYNADELSNTVLTTEAGKKAKLNFLSLIGRIGVSTDTKVSLLLVDLNRELGQLNDRAEAKNKKPENLRETIIKDNYYDMKDNHYGNANIMGLGSLHGSHVSGIIAAVRNNSLGINGVADNVQIMAIRAVPDGDEYDKDIALAIRYAVDNGAKIINMSFGKSYSPEKKWIDDAYKYAASKDVLLVHAAGNDNKNIDSTDNFPSTTFLDQTMATNVLTVGASSDIAIDKNYIASFSNYGKMGVDVFAPGSQVYSSIPGGNTYAFESGTSMASPVVAGLAALLKSYYPNLKAVEIKKIIEESVSKLDSNSICFKPGTNTVVEASSLSKTSGVVNAFNAVVLADTESKKKQKK